MQKVLVTGGGGYKGVILTRKLLELGYPTTVIDNFMYGSEPLLHLASDPNLTIIKCDIRNGVPNLSDYDIIIHLAGISGLPACDANPSSAEMINVTATKQLTRSLSQDQLIIYASTTSFYGKSGKVSSEDSQVEPVSLYGATKYRAEQIVNEHPNSISLRFATVFGTSSRMRMDLMVNNFTYRAMKEGVVVLYDGHAVRTFIHVEDVADSYIFSIENSEEMIKGKIYNVGGKNLNHSKKQIAELVKSKIDYRIIESDIKDKDLRHFYINFDKIKNLGFVPKKTVQEGIDELINIFKFYEPTSDFNVI